MSIRKVLNICGESKREKKKVKVEIKVEVEVEVKITLLRVVSL